MSLDAIETFDVFQEISFSKYAENAFQFSEEKTPPWHINWSDGIGEGKPVHKWLYDFLFADVELLF